MKMPALVVLLVVHLVTVRASPVIESNFASHDRAEKLMRILSVVDVSDRNMNTWWDQFSVSWAEYDLKVKQDPTLYCSAYQRLIAELDDLNLKVDLVITGLEAKEEQLSKIREILEHSEMGGKSGLHCKDDPEKAICKALDGLDKQAAEERIRLTAEKKKVNDEITKVENYNCDCTYNDWAGNAGACSVSCGAGTKVETRKIKWKKRNAGKDCDPNDAEKTEKCNEGCCPKDCVWEKWGPWSACPEILTSEQQYEHSHRSVLVEHECSDRGGRACEGETRRSRKCNILQIKNEIIADKEKEIEGLKEELKGLKEGCHVEEEEGCPERLRVSSAYEYTYEYKMVQGSFSGRPEWVNIITEDDYDNIEYNIWYQDGRWIFGQILDNGTRQETIRSELTSAACPIGLKWEIRFQWQKNWRKLEKIVVVSAV